MSALAKLVAISLAVSQGSSMPRNSKKKWSEKGKEYFKEMDKQMKNTEKLKKNEEIRQAINVLKRFRRSYGTVSKRTKSKYRTRSK